MKNTRTRLGAWQVERTLGRDLSGTYYTGRRDGDRATLYVPHDGIVRRHGQLSRLLDVHRGLARAELVRLSDLAYDEDLPFLIGEPIDDALVALRSAARPTARQAVQLALAVADALIAAHDTGVFHAGLDLDNVLWAPASAPRVLGTSAAVIDLVDPDLLARGDVVALGRLLCTLVASQRAHGASDDDPLADVAHQLADPSTGLTMRTAHALLATCGRGPRARGSDPHVDRATTTTLTPTDELDGNTVDLAAAPTTAATGGDELRRLGRYRILSRLGRGGMGEVLLAEDPALRRGVAIKRIRPDLEHDPTFRVRLRREAQLAARLCHRAIVQVFDLITSDGADHVVMEYVPGPSLHTLLAGAPMAVGEVLQIATELADGLAYAHQHQVLHRDLKLENVLLGNDGQPKIADFGIARRIASDGRESLTGQGAVVGTLRAMSPEQLLGHDADARSDLFSFGVLIFELLTGTSPFAAATDVETIHRVVYHRQPRVHDVVTSVPRALSELVDQLLDKSPSARPSSARVVGERLRALIGTALVDTPVALADTPARAHAIAAGGSVTRAAAGTGDFRAWPPHPPTPSPTPSPTPPPMIRRPLVSRIQAPFVLAEIRALQGSIFRRAPEVQSALAVASRLEHAYDLRRADLFLPASDTFCAVLEPFSTTTVLTGTLRRIGYEIFPQYISILGVPARAVKETLHLHTRADLLRLICDAYRKCVVGSDSGALALRVTGTVATITDTTFMPCQLQIGVFLGAGKLTDLYSEHKLTEKRCRLRGDTACVYEIAL